MRTRVLVWNALVAPVRDLAAESVECADDAVRDHELAERAGEGEDQGSRAERGHARGVPAATAAPGRRAGRRPAP